MRNSHSGRRVGFVLSTIHTGSSLKLWHKLAERAKQDDGSFFIFPGGKLDFDSDQDILRNSIYWLVNPSNVDGVISWTSSISGSVSVQEIEKFQESFSELPFVTIGQKIEGHPCVEFDAYTGMKELVRHFINVHGARKIAFVRGPKNHKSAEARFCGYRDALQEAGLLDVAKQTLISDCYSWSNGEKGIAQLCEERKLVPGRDFDAVVVASDLMAFSVVNYLKRSGYRIPKDVLLGGFNDSVESRVSVPSFSTVHMPYAELGVAAYNKITDLLDGKDGVDDGNFEAYPVIRESCGCTYFKNWISGGDGKIKIRSREQLRDEICGLFRMKKDASDLEPILNALFENDRSRFCEIVSHRLADYFLNDGDLSNIFAGLVLLRSTMCLPTEYLEKVIRNLNVLIPQVQERVYSQKKYTAERINTVVSALKCNLLSIFDIGGLADVLRKHLKEIGIDTFALVLYVDNNCSRYVCGFSDTDGIRTEEVRFERNLLVPEQYSEDFARGVYIVQPLFVEGHSYGYIVHNYSGCDGIIYEDLRSSISSVLHGIFLFEEANEAKHIAEQAEYVKTEFFANVGGDLCDPLRDLSAKVSQMETNVTKGILDSDILSEQLLFLRSQIEAQLEKTMTLVDLTRSQVDDLPMDKKLFDVRQVLPVSVVAEIDSDMPLLYGDADKLKRALQTIFDFSERTTYIEEKLNGIHIEFYSSKFDWQKPELLLAEKIILLQYGTIEKFPNYAEIVIPWPNLAGISSEVKNVDTVRILDFSEKNAKKELFGIKTEYVFASGNADFEAGNVVLYWEPDSAPIDEWVKVYSCRRNEVFFRAPLLCYSRKMVGHTFLEILEQKVKMQRTAPVLFVNTHHTRYGTWATDANSLSISSMAEFDRILTEITPSLIVFETIDEKSIIKIRQNPKTVLVPILVLPDVVTSEENVELLCSHPRIILCNRGAAESEQFDARIQGILAGDEILPPHTGALVKKAILYLNRNASQQIVRWKLADTVHVSEDYLTRIFHKEIGLSLWEYLNRYRIYIATKMLLETNDTIYEIAENSGFQDQAYFCRVFKKIYGVPPGKIRSK